VLSIAVAIMFVGLQAPTLVGTWIGHPSTGKYKLSRTVTFYKDGTYGEHTIASYGTGSTATDIKGTYSFAGGRLTVVQVTNIVTDPATKKQLYASKKPFTVTVPLKLVDRNHFDFGRDPANLVRYTRIKRVIKAW
jgi:hypothetical protein